MRPIYIGILFIKYLTWQWNDTLYFFYVVKCQYKLFLSINKIVRADIDFLLL